VIEIKINVTLRTLRHVASPHTFFDECGQTEIVMKKVQKEADKILKKRKIDKVSKKK